MRKSKYKVDFSKTAVWCDQWRIQGGCSGARVPPSHRLTIIQQRIIGPKYHYVCEAEPEVIAIAQCHMCMGVVKAIAHVYVCRMPCRRASSTLLLKSLETPVAIITAYVGCLLDVCCHTITQLHTPWKNNAFDNVDYFYQLLMY